MIKNDRQYRVTKSQLLAFEEALSKLSYESLPADIDPGLLEIQQRAVKSQLEDLSSELIEYEALKTGQVAKFVAESIADLPLVLIKARIALGITHRELAERLNVKEQQVQRWEAEDYAGATLKTLKSIADALQVETRQELFLPNKGITSKGLINSLVEAGLSREFIMRRLFPGPLAAALEREVGAGLKEILRAASEISRIFGGSISEIIESKYPAIPLLAVARPRFKLPANANTKLVNAYTVYAHYLASLVVDCTSDIPSQSLPTTSGDFHAAITGIGSPANFEKALELAWRCGIIVLPLQDTGAFHGAVWRIKGYYVVVLKQTTTFESRWLYDLLHEIGHIHHGHVTDDIAFIEAQPISPEIEIEDEQNANEWAEDSLFDNRSEEIEKACVQACRGKLQNLKAVLPSIATHFNVNLGSLANHMAYRLQEQNENFWGAANNLQSSNVAPFELARNSLLRKINLQKLNPLDRDILIRAISEK